MDNVAVHGRVSWAGAAFGGRRRKLRQRSIQWRDERVDEALGIRNLTGLKADRIRVRTAPPAASTAAPLVLTVRSNSQVRLNPQSNGDEYAAKPLRSLPLV